MKVTSTNYANATILSAIRTSKWTKVIAFLLAVELLTGNLIGQKAFALTSGPSQPEATNFQPASVSELVDPFSGDFSYNIPVMEIGGYPINLSYASGITMDQEATWTGLGWNLNTGAIVRNMRGLPDDFKGDQVAKEYNVKDNKTYGVNVGLGVELFGGGLGISYGIDASYNNYTGYNIAQSFNPSIGAAAGAAGNLNVGLGLTSSSSGGLTIAPSVSFSTRLAQKGKNDVSAGLGIGLPMNSRSGLGQLSFNASLSSSKKDSYTNKQGAKVNDSRSMGSASLVGASLSFATPTYTPMVQHPMINEAQTYNGMIGVGVVGADLDIKVGGYLSGQKLATKATAHPAYGYMYSEFGQGGDNAMQDFNREKDGGYSPKTTTKLPLTNYSYDVLQIQAQGLGGSIRPFRNEASYVHDNHTVSPSISGSLGFELSVTQLIDGGVNGSVTDVKTESGMWNVDNMAKDNMPFSHSQANTLKEKVHFRMAGERTVDSDSAFYANMGGDRAVRFGVENLKLNRTLVSSAGTQVPFSGSIKRSNRQNRVSSVECLTIAEVRSLYPYRAKKYFPAGNGGYMKNHHIGQITVIKPDGTRYVFGLPAYNLTQQEITFAIGKGMENPTAASPDVNGNFSYDPNDNNVNGNNNGIDHRYDKTTMPAYVHTWYLTEILSPDYVDVTGDGPSEDDIGNYTVFEYGVKDTVLNKNVPDIANYKWRTPTASAGNKAGYNKNLHTDDTDDTGNIIYGEKQVWYVHKIESKTQVCVFTLSDRQDGFGVSGVNGGAVNANPLKKIDKISLYAKEDWENYENNPGTAPLPLAVKVAHFEYDYTLCDGIPNNNSGNGKLTLKSVWFTFEKSGRARYSPYKFDYSSLNPAYDPRANDKWGNYRPYSIAFPNEDLPYVDPDSSHTNSYAEAWSLKQIKLPSGGIITVDYEADDYGYVQDRQACRMFQVIGAGGAGATYPYDNRLFEPNSNHDDLYLYFKLETPIVAANAAAAADIVRQKYFVGSPAQENGPTKFLYFRFYINVGADQTKKEYVSGYAEIDLSNINVSHEITTGTWDVGVVKLKGVQKGDSGPDDFSPIAKSAWQFSRIQTPGLAFNQVPPTDDSFEGVMQTLANSSFLNTLAELFQGVNGRLRSNGIGCYFDNNKSLIRLIDPNGIKQGGGHRVKSVQISDNWAAMTNNNESDFSYGQEYDYKNDDGTSSGVAAWEPAMGADENPFRMPIFMDKKVLAAPDEQFYIEEPLGECFFPGPSVGYSKVTIKNLQHTNVTVNATGRSVHEFYTAKDFPTKVDLTQLYAYREKSPFAFTFLVNISFDKMAVSQGYCIINNDMHGKPRIESIYDQGGTLISQTKYDYQQNTDGSLDNYVKVIEPDGKVKNKLVGVDYDFVADMRSMKTNTTGAGLQVNAAAFLAGFFPLIIPTLFPDITTEETLFRSGTATKTIFKSGILKSTTVFDKGAIVKTENIAYDGRTGEVLVTKVNNEYNKERYAVSYPAHWAYDRMGFAASNWGYVFKIPYNNASTYEAIDTATHIINPLYAPTTVLVPGDELMPIDWRMKVPLFPTNSTSNSTRLWVAEDENGDKYLIDKDGMPYIVPVTGGDLYYKVVRSGRRNMGTMGMGSAEVLQNPLTTTFLDIDDLKVLNVSAQEFSEHWRTKIFRMNAQVYSSVTCGAEAKETKLIMLLNQLIDNNKFVRNWSFPVPNPLDVSLTYGDYNITGLLPSIPGECEYYYTSVATGYTPPIMALSSLGFTDNAWMIMSFKPKQNDCVNCMEYFAISLSPQSEFEAADFDDVAYFSSVITISDYLGLPGTNPYAYLLANQDDIFISRAVMEDGSTHDFLFYSSCPMVIPSASNCCTVEERYECSLDTINPYLYGVLGNWRPVKSHTYLTNRYPAAVTSVVDRSTDGYFTMNDGYFWKRPTSPGDKWAKTLTYSGTGWRWAWTAEITNYNNAGGEVENVNPLNIYSSAVYGYKQTLPIMVAQNAKYKEIGFDGFEDYSSLANANLDCVKEHFKVGTQYWEHVTDSAAHTGRFSYRYNTEGDAPVFSYETSPVQVRRDTAYVPYVLNHNSRLTTFSPDDGVEKKFILSFWVKVDDDLFDMNEYSYANNGFEGVVKVGGTALTLDPPKLSPIIDGWQQFEYEFTLPNTTNATSVEITFTGAGGYYFIDDVRVHPFDALAKSYVYSSRNLRFMAELDENNYATFYEYDEDGSLIRVKKETERGILTLKENRSKSYKTNP